MPKKIINKFFIEKTNSGLLRFCRYLVAGGTATLVDLVMLFVLYQLVGINYLVAAAFSYMAGIITNYTINIAIVFESTGKKKKEFSLFALIGIGGLLWTELILSLLVGNAHWPVLTAKLVAVVLVLNWNFFMRKKFVFSCG